MHKFEVFLQLPKRLKTSNKLPVCFTVLAFDMSHAEVKADCLLETYAFKAFRGASILTIRRIK